MGTPTYTLIQEQILTSSQAAVTFLSIPQIYEDLVLEISGTASTGATYWMRPNSDASDIYSYTQIYGTGSTVASGRATSPGVGTAGMDIGYPATTGTIQLVNIMSYANTNMFKMAIATHTGSENYAAAVVSLWRSTAAITSLYLYPSGGTISAGSTFRLYGLVA